MYLLYLELSLTSLKLPGVPYKFPSIIYLKRPNEITRRKLSLSGRHELPYSHQSLNVFFELISMPQFCVYRLVFKLTTQSTLGS